MSVPSRPHEERMRRARLSLDGLDELANVFARRFREDRHRGYGPKAQEILELIYMGTPWKLAARTPYRDGSKGNGSAMRVAPVGAWFADDLERVAAEARASAEITHALRAPIPPAWLTAREPLG